MNAHVHPAPVRAPQPARWPNWLFRGSLLVWGVGIAGFSALLGLAEGTGGGGWVDLFGHFMLSGIILALAATVWVWPRWGGFLLAAAGLWGVWYFPHPFADLALATPAVVIGTLGLLHRR